MISYWSGGGKREKGKRESVDWNKDSGVVFIYVCMYLCMYV